MMPGKIQEIEIPLWDRIMVRFKANQGVNILVGINGSGKTTLLTKIQEVHGSESEDGLPLIYIPSIDNLFTRDNRKKSNALTQALESYIYDMKEGPSLMYYRMSMLDASSADQQHVKERIKEFCSTVNELFKDTGKHIEIEGNKFLVFSGNDLLPVSKLSSGEKQVLLILLRVFLLEEREAIVLIDEPESSLDISWQYRLIDILVSLNHNAQFFITTHSPSIFGDGWGDNIIYMEDVTTPI